jgi:hypothetical protein
MITDNANPNGLEAQAAKRQEEIKAAMQRRAEAAKSRAAKKAGAK